MCVYVYVCVWVYVRITCVRVRVCECVCVYIYDVLSSSSVVKGEMNEGRVIREDTLRYIHAYIREMKGLFCMYHHK